MEEGLREGARRVVVIFPPQILLLSVFEFCSFPNLADNRQKRPHDDDEFGTLSVILVVILPVGQMILTLILILVFRLCYLRYCKRSKTKSWKRRTKNVENDKTLVKMEKFWWKSNNFVCRWFSIWIVFELVLKVSKLSRWIRQHSI